MSQQKERVHSLDVLRGLAALSVVFWHWQHFFYSSGKLGTFLIQQQPFFNQFELLYTHGSLAVELFFSISGFVFFWLYSDAISEKKIKASKFAMDRFSRLYPLHIATFAFIAIAQTFYFQWHGSYFVYQENDLRHAILNILLIPAWGFEKGWSFNAPIWSVSVEVMLYALFFISMKTGRSRYALIGALALAGFFITPDNYKIGHGLYSFFLGGASYSINRKIFSAFGERVALVVSAVVAAASWVAIAYSKELNMTLLMGLAYPSSMAFLFNLEKWIKPIASQLSIIGEISYSSYLLHFPLQLIFAMVVEKFGIDRHWFYSQRMFVVFMLVLIPLCLISHRYFEAPAQKAIRDAFRNKQQAKAWAPD
ncbi:acyltransferase family protein [Xanthomonas albilineans]|uniref:acyltransferase family protein n=1 Tax=Xanthomonas albilineans TaxID=29447 RepID=UPI0005F33B4A|nr:acyltransferase [Xanthomonas albilineans]PPU94137.1 acyltransferase [Xanthomonas albilineans]